jgi:hypothetical protein
LVDRAKAARRNHPDLWLAGLRWYDAEAARLEGMALALGIPAGILKAVAAVLSPGNSWGVLLDRLPRFVRAVQKSDIMAVAPWPPVFPTYSANRHKAVELLKGHGIPADLVIGRKVWPFYCALAGDGQAVVLGAVEHRAAVAGFRTVAAGLGLNPRDLQAALWTVDVGAGGDTGGALAKAGARRVEA